METTQDKGLVPASEESQARTRKIRDEMGRFVQDHPGTLKRYQTREELMEAVMNFITTCEDDKTVPTMTGLALALGFRNRTSLVGYQKEPGYEFAFEVIQYAKMRIEDYLEKRLLDPKNFNIAGLIFNLKNNFNWVDRQEVRMDQRTVQLTGFNFNSNTNGEHEDRPALPE